MQEQQQQHAIPEVFITRLTEAQFSLFNHISFLLGNSEAARDVLQETNLDLWRKAATYDPTRPFLPWAKALAQYQVLTYRKRQTRERLVFDDELTEQALAEATEEEDGDFVRMAGFLKSCRERLNAFQRAVLDARYAERQPLSAIARTHACSVPAVGMSLLRIRGVLARCIREKMSEGRP